MTARPITADPWIERGIAAANESVRILRADNDAAHKHSTDCYCHDCCRQANTQRVNRAMFEILAERDAAWLAGEERLK